MSEPKIEDQKIEIDPYYWKMLATAVVIGLMVYMPYAFISDRVGQLLKTPGINGGHAFWTMIEGKLYNLADEPDLPPERKEKIIKALQKLSAKYHPYVDALFSAPSPAKQVTAEIK